MSKQLGRVYTIINILDLTKSYIGSTFGTLKNRLSKHKSYIHDVKHKHRRLYQDMIKSGTDKFIICLLDKGLFTLKELRKLEGYYIKLFNPFYNYLIAGEGGGKEWYENNKKKVYTRNKVYVQKNKGKVSRYQKKYRIENKTEIDKHKQKYENKNRVIINEKKRQRYHSNPKFKVIHTCECGGTYTINHKARHEKTKKHLTHKK